MKNSVKDIFKTSSYQTYPDWYPEYIQSRRRQRRVKISFFIQTAVIMCLVVIITLALFFLVNKTVKPETSQPEVLSTNDTQNTVKNPKVQKVINKTFRYPVKGRKFFK